MAELVCELLYAGKTRKEIAGYDDLFLRYVLCRPRDETGRLRRHNPELPRWVTENLDANGHWRIKNAKPFSAMMRQLMEHQGLDEEQRQVAWERWRAENPNFGKVI